MYKIMIFTLFLLSASVVLADNPVPYTEEAHKKFVASAIAHQKQYDQSLPKEIYFESMVKDMYAIYSDAGYDFDDTIAKVRNDFEFHPERIPNRPNSISTSVVVSMHFLVSECVAANVDCYKFFPDHTAESIKWIIENIQFKL